MAKEPTENVSWCAPMNLLAIVDHHCCSRDLNRSQVITRAIRSYLATQLAKDKSFWEREYTRLQDEGKI